MDTCRLWVSLGSGRRHRGEPQPTTFLRFIRTGLLVGLPDEPGALLAEGGPLKQLPMRRVDAEGLGLTAEDFAEGVAICREDPTSAGVGWQCERVQLLVGAEERIAVTAPRVQPATTGAAATTTPAPPPAATAAAAVRPQRILAVVDADAADDATVDEAAALAREHRATLLLVATGELAETSRHAAEERAALTLRLQELAAPLADLTVRWRVEMGGDPVRGILAIADAEDIDLILAPARHSRFADAVEPRIAAALERRSAVPVRVVSEPDAPAGTIAPVRAAVDAARIVIAGRPRGAADEAWAAAAEAAARRALTGVAFTHAALAVDARWYAAPGASVDHFALARVIAAVAAQPAWPAGVAPHVARLASETIVVADAADERLEVDVRSA